MVSESAPMDLTQLCMTKIDTLHTSCDYCCLLIAFANSLDPDQTGHFVRPDLGPNCFDTVMVHVSLKFVLKKKKSQRNDKKACKE